MKNTVPLLGLRIYHITDTVAKGNCNNIQFVYKKQIHIWMDATYRKRLPSPVKNVIECLQKLLIFIELQRDSEKKYKISIFI